MRRFWAVLLGMTLVSGCAAYKELVPDPQITPVERGYVPLKEGEDNFRLEKEKKYYLELPGPGRKDFQIVLTTDKKWAIDALLTRIFDDKEGPGERIPDEATADTLMVYAVDATAETYFWVIENVRAEVELTLTYRYVPRWRYAFETKYESYRQTLERNTADRSTYDAIDDQYSFHGFNFRSQRESLKEKTRQIVAVNEELQRLGILFPPEVVSTRDTAYEKYLSLKGRVADELQFQMAYASVLNVFERLETSRGSSMAFLESAPVFVEFLGASGRHPSHITDRARREITSRLPEALPHYETQLSDKRDITRIVLRPPLEPVLQLYGATGGTVPVIMETLKSFVDRFNLEAGAVQNANARLRSLEQLPESGPRLLSDTLYAGMIAEASEAVRMLPQQTRLDTYERYRTLPCTAQLRQEVTETIARAAAYQGLFQTARVLAGNIRSSAWQTSETLLRDMTTSDRFSTPAAVDRHRSQLASRLENEMFNRILAATRARAEAFTQKHLGTVVNVPALYADTSLSPVYMPTFSASGQGELARKRQQLGTELDQIRYYRFPENAIRTIYRSLSENMADRGVEKARAIVDHGKNYRGSDKQVAMYVEECDATVPKAVTRAKDYRRALALPVTSNRSGNNEYLVRLSLKIPTEAQFPVYDVNVKLPKEVAQQAGARQWYETITIDRKPIKNEGRFRITSPTAQNGYESLITPVQMDRKDDNILEIRFLYPGLRVFEISAMAQVPIIRKN